MSTTMTFLEGMVGPLMGRGASLPFLGVRGL